MNVLRWFFGPYGPLSGKNDGKTKTRKPTEPAANDDPPRQDSGGNGGRTSG